MPHPAFVGLPVQTPLNDAHGAILFIELDCQNQGFFSFSDDYYWTGGNEADILKPIADRRKRMTPCR
jgi:hypothetical protein